MKKKVFWEYSYLFGPLLRRHRKIKWDFTSFWFTQFFSMVPNYLPIGCKWTDFDLPCVYSCPRLPRMWEKLILNFDTKIEVEINHWFDWFKTYLYLHSHSPKRKFIPNYFSGNKNYLSINTYLSSAFKLLKLAPVRKRLALSVIVKSISSVITKRYYLFSFLKLIF